MLNSSSVLVPFAVLALLYPAVGLGTCATSDTCDEATSGSQHALQEDVSSLLQVNIVKKEQVSLQLESEPTLSMYDASGKYPSCLQSTKSYMRKCLMPSNPYFYAQAYKPILAEEGKTCQDMGYKLVIPKDIYFRATGMYWGGDQRSLFPKDMLPFVLEFNATHAGYEQAIQFSMSQYGGCQDGYTEAEFKSMNSGYPREPVPDDNAPSAFYDASGYLPQCLEGPYSYMQNCVFTSHWLAYYFAKKPTIVKNASCKTLGYDRVKPELAMNLAASVFNVTLYWKGGPSALKVFSADYGAGHPDMDRLVTVQRDANPSCKVNHAWAPSLLSVALVLLLVEKNRRISWL